MSLRSPPGSCQNRKPPANDTIFFRGRRAGFSTCVQRTMGRTFVDVRFDVRVAVNDRKLRAKDTGFFYDRRAEP